MGYKIMIDKSLFKTIYYTKYGAKYQIISSCFLQGIEHYTVNDRYPEPEHPKGFGLQIISQEEINNDLLHQDEYEAEHDKREKYDEEQAEKQRLRIEKETKAKAELENLYGFDSGLTPMQRGKLLKVLLKEYRYDGIVMTRKDFLYKNINNGCTVKQVDNVISYYGSRWDKKESKPKTEYRLMVENNFSYTITKTEFEFANYLINKCA